MYTVDWDDREALAYLNRLAGRLGDMTPALSDIGEYLAETTKRRFESSTGPDGQRWAPNTETTIRRYLGLFKGGAAGKKPLIGETKSLMSTIHYQLAGNSAVEIGSPMEYSAVQQFGADKGSLGGGAPWGDIPARPFLGVSADDEREILDIIDGYLGG